MTKQAAIGQTMLAPGRAPMSRSPTLSNHIRPAARTAWRHQNLYRRFQLCSSKQSQWRPTMVERA